MSKTPRYKKLYISKCSIVPETVLVLKPPYRKWSIVYQHVLHSLVPIQVFYNNVKVCFRYGKEHSHIFHKWTN